MKGKERAFSCASVVDVIDFFTASKQCVRHPALFLARETLACGARVDIEFASHRCVSSHVQVSKCCGWRLWDGSTS